jgi:hypothetical protein
MNKPIVPMGIGLLALTVLLATLHAQFEHPDVKSGKKAIHSVLVLPAEAKIVKSGMKGNEPLVEESHRFELTLTSSVSETMAGRGCTVLPDVFSPAALDANPDLKYALADLQSRYDKLQEQLAKKPKDVRAGRFTLGDEVANFSPSAAADALVFVRGGGVISTTGKALFGALTGVGGGSYLGSAISIVDAQTGSILYYGTPGALKKLPICAKS